MTASDPPGTSHQPDTGGQPARPRVLIVDDEPSILAALRRQLRGEFDIAIAADAAAGLELIARDGPFDVVVSDMRMPGMDGTAFLARVRSIARDTSRILLTGQADLDAAVAAINQGQIFRFLSKPCPARTLRLTLHEAAEQYRTATAERQIIDQSLAIPVQRTPDTDPEAAAELAAALQAGQLTVWYQPVIDLATGHITSAEALIRWQHPTRGLLLPSQFMPSAERSGLIIPIGRRVLWRACHDAAAWPPGPAGPLSVAVNLEAGQLRDPRLLDDVRRALSGSGLAASRLILEITESVLLHDPHAAAQELNRLRDMGITIAVDDFGTGYSSLSYLQHLPVSILKVDKAFVTSLPQPTPMALARAIVQLAATLGLKTVAEGIETDIQLGACRDLGCQRGQGFLLAKPMPNTTITRTLHAHATPHPAAAHRHSQVT